VNVLVWHVHGSWTTAFVQGRHRYLVPTLRERGPWGGGRPAAWDWPASAVEVSPDELADADVDVVVLQRLEEVDLAERWLGRRPGRDVPAVFLEHNAPRGGPAATSRHPLADLADAADLLLVHVTHFNDLMWDAGELTTAVVEHGIVDPGHRYTGELAAAAVCVNEPIRRGRVTGTDLLPRFARAAPLDVFGMGTDGLGAHVACAGVRTVGDLPQHRMHDEMARRRAYVHPLRWTSLGLALLEAMHLGMPVVALATTEAHEAVPPGAGICSTDVDRLVRELRVLVAEPDRARALGAAGRAHVLNRYGLDRFLADWDAVLDRVTNGHRRRGRTPVAAGRVVRR
jgi:glycosyltransferase involved in cell wall biosynthesis